jgi:hypothetical protein
LSLLLIFSRISALIGSVDRKQTPNLDLNGVTERRRGLWRGFDHLENWATDLLIDLVRAAAILPP